MTPSTGTKKAFSRVVIDAQLKDVGWNLTDGQSVRVECASSKPEGLAGFNGRWVMCYQVFDAAFSQSFRQLPGMSLSESKQRFVMQG